MNKLVEKLSSIQGELKAPKGQYNSFGKYKYRSCEDIVESVKPLLAKKGMALVITDSIQEVGSRCYVKAEARVICSESGESLAASAFAREPENKKGMDDSQITGAASSYARKYALNGLLAIDDTKDADVDAPPEKANIKAVKSADVLNKTQKEALLTAAGRNINIVRRAKAQLGIEGDIPVTRLKEMSDLVREISEKGEAQ